MQLVDMVVGAQVIACRRLGKADICGVNVIAASWSARYSSAGLWLDTLSTFRKTGGEVLPATDYAQ